MSKSSGEPIGWLDYDKWRVRIIVTSDDAQGFEGHLGFTLTRNGMEIDRPAFKFVVRAHAGEPHLFFQKPK